MGAVKEKWKNSTFAEAVEVMNFSQEDQMSYLVVSSCRKAEIDPPAAACIVVVCSGCIGWIGGGEPSGVLGAKSSSSPVSQAEVDSCRSDNLTNGSRARWSSEWTEELVDRVELRLAC